MKKQWISVKCGLSRDPKHRQQMGESVWLFLHILDRADWESGKVMEWKDEGEAEDMGMPVRTLREHRRKLEELNYITSTQKQYGQEITIHNWTNPREYNGQVYNKKQGDASMSPRKTERGYTQGYTQGNRKHVTPTYDSNIKESHTTSVFALYESNIGPLTPIIADNLIDLEKTYSEKWITLAIGEAANNNVRKLSYIEGVLKGYKDRGSPDIPREKRAAKKGQSKNANVPASSTQEYPEEYDDIAARIKASRAK